MPDIIRTVRPDELESFGRFLERVYGHRKGFFTSYAPELYEQAQELAQHCLVIERDGRIVSHVGAYPMQIALGPARISAGGVGAVGTDPRLRGQGLMSRLLDESIRRMKERGWTLSVLWGDRQRYGAFGYETCGLRHTLTLTRRSLEWAGVEPAEVEEVFPDEPGVAERLEQLHQTLGYRVVRPLMRLQLHRGGGLRVFTSPEGYMLTSSHTPGHVSVTEIVSPTGREAAIVLAVLQGWYSDSATVSLGAGETDRLERLTAVMSHWSTHPQGQFRILSWHGLLEQIQPYLALRAAGLPAFTACVGCCWAEETEWATVRWDGHELTVEPTRTGDGLEVDLPLLTALTLGGPQVGRERLGGLGQLLPAPVHVPELDHV